MHVMRPTLTKQTQEIFQSWGWGGVAESTFELLNLTNLSTPGPNRDMFMYI